MRLLILSFLSIPLFFPTVRASAPDTASRPIVTTFRSEHPILIDGELNEKDWQRAPLTGFVQKDPVEGAPASQKTEVWTAYDDAAIYIAARLNDSRPDSIVQRIGRRDSDIKADWFYVAIDSYHDRRTAFYFGVYAGGSVTDGTHYNDSWDDNSWDGVWDAASIITDSGWNVEMRIPYSQLRFSKEESYTWGINFGRQLERRKEESYFVMVPKGESGWVSRFADLVGIREISPPARLEILPYVVGSTLETNQFHANDPFNDGLSFTRNMGADLKLGLGSNLTLDATINPDFGQVEVDPAVVNLSQFETFYDEKRPFFIEGSNYFSFGQGGANSNWSFNWGNPNFFYSRRIGRSPQGRERHEGFTDRPDGTTILFAGKVTGKIMDGWSLAALSAVTQREYSRVDDGNGNRYRDLVEPMASYSVVRSQREFNSGTRALGFIGTATFRELKDAFLVDRFNRRAFAFGIDGWTNLDPKRQYVLTGWLSTTRVEGTPAQMVAIQRSPLHYYQRPDIDYVSLDSTARSLSGLAGRFAINKQEGNMKLNTAFGFITPGFESNDMGFLFRTDAINMHLALGYNWYQPAGLFRRRGFTVATFRNYTFGKQRTGEGYFLMGNAELTNYWEVFGDFNFNRAVIDNRATRGGPMMMTTNQYGGGIGVETDSRHAFVGSFGVFGGRSESGGHRIGVSPGLEVKPAPNVSVRISPEFMRDITIAQYVHSVADSLYGATYGKRYIFGKLDQKEFSSSVRVDWTFTPKLSLQVYMQPLISVGSYGEFKELREPGTYTFNVYGQDNGSEIVQTDEGYSVDPDGASGSAESFALENPDFNFKSLRGNAVLRWEYLPGSTIFFVWTHGQTNFDNPGDFKFGRDLGRMLGAPDHENVFLIKLAYWWQP